jgi:hypothetical protein
VKGLSRVLCAVDIDEPGRAAFAHLALARAHTASMIIVYAVPPNQCCVGPEILRAARATQTDVVVVGSRSRSRSGRRMFGVIGQLLKEAPCPVLAVPARAAAVRERDERRYAA